MVDNAQTVLFYSQIAPFSCTEMYKINCRPIYNDYQLICQTMLSILLLITPSPSFIVTYVTLRTLISQYYYRNVRQILTAVIYNSHNECMTPFTDLGHFSFEISPNHDPLVVVIVVFSEGVQRMPDDVVSSMSVDVVNCQSENSLDDVLIRHLQQKVE